jgi:lysophospholipase L1-like esterase
MNQYTTKRSVALIVAGLASLGLLLQPILGQTVRPRRIAVFGSSVANGTGDELRKEGYTGRLREVLAPRGWEVLNQSRGGDNTRTLAARWAPEGTPNP